MSDAAAPANRADLLPVVRPELAELGPWISGDAAHDARTTELKRAIADRVGTEPAEIVLGPGTAALLGAVADAFGVRRNRAPATAMALTPSLRMYKWSLRSRGLKLIEVPLTSTFEADVAMLERAVSSMRPNLMVLGSPNDPTGVPLEKASLDRILAATTAGATPTEEPPLVIVDESASAPAASLRAARSAQPSLAILRAAPGIAWLEMDSRLTRELDKMPGFAPDTRALEAAIEVVSTGFRELETSFANAARAVAALGGRIAALPDFEVTTTATRFVWIGLPASVGVDASAVVARAESAKIAGVSGGGVGRLARRLRIEWTTDEDATRVLDLLASLKS